LIIVSSYWGPKRCQSLILMICRYAIGTEAGASRREAAESFNLCPSSAVKWLQRWRDTGSAKAKPTGGSRLRLEKHAKELLALVAERPDSTLDEIVAAMHKLRIRGSPTAVWRFFARHDFTFKKTRRSYLGQASMAVSRPPQAIRIFSTEATRCRTSRKSIAWRFRRALDLARRSVPGGADKAAAPGSVRNCLPRCLHSRPLA
jgi:transposase